MPFQGLQDWQNFPYQVWRFFICYTSLFFPSNMNKLKKSYMEENDEINPERVMESSLELNNGTALWLPFTQLSESGLSGNEVE